MIFDPNPEQRAAIEAHDGAIALISGPGSGKTATLTARRDSLISAGDRANEILCATFTKEAALEMESRSGKGHFRTFHSYGYSILTAEKGKLPFEPELRHRLLYSLVKRYQVDYKELAAYISFCRAHPLERGFGSMFAAYEAYEVERKTAGWIDFDCMIHDAIALLQNPEVRARHQWKYVMADECQDTDDSQFQLLQLITEKHGNVMCVGDPGQSIYMFRGAKPENLVELNRWFANARTLYLGRGYRSTKTITDYVRKHYPLNIPLKEKIIAARTEVGVPIEYRLFHNEFTEMETAVAEANRDPMNSAILARTNRGLAFAETICQQTKPKPIPYTLLGKSGFFKKTEIIRAFEKLKPYGDMPVETAMSIVMPELESHYRAADATPEDNFALENVKTLREIGKKFASMREFSIFANKAAHARRQKKGLTLGTIHAAKGTEYKNVFVVQVRQDMIPHAKGDYSEEQRIWLVAVSRPKDRLRISWAGAPGQFIKPELTAEDLKRLEAEASKPFQPEQKAMSFEELMEGL